MAHANADEGVAMGIFALTELEVALVLLELLVRPHGLQPGEDIVSGQVHLAPQKIWPI